MVPRRKLDFINQNDLQPTHCPQTLAAVWLKMLLEQLCATGNFLCLKIWTLVWILPILHLQLDFWRVTNVLKTLTVARIIMNWHTHTHTHTHTHKKWKSYIELFFFFLESRQSHFCLTGTACPELGYLEDCVAPAWWCFKKKKKNYYYYHMPELITLFPGLRASGPLINILVQNCWVKAIVAWCSLQKLFYKSSRVWKFVV